MTESNDNSGYPESDGGDDHMSDYLQVFLDETDEELEKLVESLLRLESRPTDTPSLNEAFRLLHSLKGSSGMMGYLGLSKLAHQLENRFEAYRSGGARLDRESMNVILDCMDFMKSFSTALRQGESFSDDAAHLIERLEGVQVDYVTALDAPDATATPAPPTESSSAETSRPSQQGSGRGYRIRVKFEPGLQLADLKARLIVARLSNIGEIIESEPSIDDLQSFVEIPQFVVVVWTQVTPEEVRRIAEVDGVESAEIEFQEDSADDGTILHNDGGTHEPSDSLGAGSVSSPGRGFEHLVETGIFEAPLDDSSDDFDLDDSIESTAADFTESGQFRDPVPTSSPPSKYATSAQLKDSNKARHKEPQKLAISETVRVDTDRLDRLMNLTGELVVTRARFSQITDQIMSRLRASKSAHRIRNVSERIRANLKSLNALKPAETADTLPWDKILQQLEQELVSLDEHSEQWERERGVLTQFAEAVDQLTRVTNQLQQGVLDTRMVPVGPLFSRFKRVIRDLSIEFNKQVQLVIKGDKTELDKRMIDELSDPLLHLVRNSLDHGLESLEQRRKSGKPEVGTITLEASHSGNNVLIVVGDDGAGLNLDRIKTRVVERGLAEAHELDAMSDSQLGEFIWHPGFSTAEQVTDISGRGVGMDIVRKRIADLKGTVDVETIPGKGTRFRIRLPLTLAIIQSLLVRYRDGLFSIPIDDIREVVSIEPAEIYQVHKHKTIDVRGEFIPFVAMSNLFEWNTDSPSPGMKQRNVEFPEQEKINVVILQAGHQTLGLSVDELVGGEDTVVKSLSENFVPIKGLSGASIMGDGSVCLMLDTMALFDLARERVLNASSRWNQSVTGG